MGSPSVRTLIRNDEKLVCKFSLKSNNLSAQTNKIRMNSLFGSQTQQTQILSSIAMTTHFTPSIAIRELQIQGLSSCQSKTISERFRQKFISDWPMRVESEISEVIQAAESQVRMPSTEECQGVSACVEEEKLTVFESPCTQLFLD